MFDQFYAEQLPKMQSYAVMQALNRDAGAALLDRIGPASILTHSESGAYGWLVGDARPHLVRSIVAVEPAGPPVYDATFHKEGALSRPWGLACQPLAYSPPLVGAQQLSFIQQDAPEGPGLLACWLQQEPARELINLKKIPIMILTGEASYHAGYDHCTARYLNQAGVNATHLRLTDHGIRGNGHMMMLENNNIDIADVIASWLEKNVLAETLSAQQTHQVSQSVN
jgi:pimeloyl-ACP methyl ester carboxylesterase